MARVLKINPEKPDLFLLQKVHDQIRQGEIVAFPTETFYGLGTNALNPVAVEKIFEAKGRDSSSPILVLVRDFAQASELIRSVPEGAKRLISKFWPGPLTLVFDASAKVPPALTGGTGKVGLRIPANLFVLFLLKTFSVPLTATSANCSGNPSPTTAEQVEEDLGEKIGWILDAGPSPGGKPSSVLDLTTQPFTLIREGRVSAEELGLR